MKKIIIVLFSIFTVANVSAQVNNNNFTFTYGLGFLFSDNKTYYVNQVQNSYTTVYQLKVLASGLNAFLFPKYHFVNQPKQSSHRNTSKRQTVIEDKSYDFSLGAPTMLGFGGIFSTQNGTQTSFMYKTGITADINFGACKLNSQKMFGAFAGLGLGVANTSNVGGTISQVSNTYYDANNITVSDISNYRPKALGFGPIMHVGAQVGLRRIVGVYFSYQPALNKNGLNYYTIAAQIPFLTGGRYFY